MATYNHKRYELCNQDRHGKDLMIVFFSHYISASESVSIYATQNEQPQTRSFTIATSASYIYPHCLLGHDYTIIW